LEQSQQRLTTGSPSLSASSFASALLPDAKRRKEEECDSVGLANSMRSKSNWPEGSLPKEKLSVRLPKPLMFTLQRSIGCQPPYLKPVFCSVSTQYRISEIVFIEEAFICSKAEIRQLYFVVHIKNSVRP
jgi:hypothetical protein